MRISTSYFLCFCSIFGFLIFYTGASECPKDFTRVANKCYFVSLEKTNWFEADRKCRSLNSNLFVFADEQERKMITNYVTGVGVKFTTSYGDSVWIGSNSLGTNRTFVLAKNGEPLMDNFWCSGEPNSDVQACVAYGGIQGVCTIGYHDYECTSYFPFVCETVPQHTSDYLCLKREKLVGAGFSHCNNDQAKQNIIPMFDL